MWLWDAKCSCDVQYVVMQCGGVEWSHAECSLMRIMRDVQLCDVRCGGAMSHVVLWCGMVCDVKCSGM